MCTKGEEMKQINISKELVESFGYAKQLDEFSVGDTYDTAKNIVTNPEIQMLAAKNAAAGVAGYGAGKVASKLLGRAVPGATFGLNAYDAKNRWEEGDKVGSVISGASALASLVPGLGTAVAFGLDGVNLGIDYLKNHSTSSSQQPTPQNKQEERADKLALLQKVIGTKDDGIYGPKTYKSLVAWQQQHGLTPNGIPGEETFAAAGLLGNNNMENKQQTTVAEDIAFLRNKLLIIENTDQLDEAGAGWGKALSAAEKATNSASSGFGKVGKSAGWGSSATADAEKAASAAKSAPKPSSFDTGEFGKGMFPPKAASAMDMEKLSKYLANPGFELKATEKVMANEAVAAADKAAIKQRGLAVWIKENPGKSALIAGILGFGAGYGLASYMHDDDPNPYPPIPPTPVPHNGGGTYDPKVAEIQRELKNKGGYNIAVDGIWGPKTQQAYDWYYGDESGSPGIQGMQKLKQSGVDIQAQNKKEHDALDAQNKTSRMNNAKHLQAELSKMGMSPAEQAAKLRQTFPGEAEELLKTAQPVQATTLESIAYYRDILKLIENN